MKDTTIRIISAAVGLPILIAVCVLGGWPLKIGLLVITLMGMREVYHPLSGGFKTVHVIGYAVAAVYLLWIEMWSGRMMMIPIVALVLGCLAGAVVFHPRVAVRDVVAVIFGFFYVAFLLSCVYLIRENSPRGGYAVWLAFIAAWGCDTGAYAVGRLFGRRKLMPSLSPKKTVEGAVGGVVFAAALAVLYVFCLRFFWHGWEAPPQVYLASALVCGAGAVMGQVGDLAASAIKRYAKIKDFGNVIPGHGGILDRFDSVLFTAPMVYTIALLIWHV